MAGKASATFFCADCGIAFRVDDTFTPYLDAPHHYLRSRRRRCLACFLDVPAGPLALDLAAPESVPSADPRHAVLTAVHGALSPLPDHLGYVLEPSSVGLHQRLAQDAAVDPAALAVWSALVRPTRFLVKDMNDRLKDAPGLGARQRKALQASIRSTLSLPTKGKPPLVRATADGTVLKRVVSTVASAPGLDFTSQLVVSAVNARWAAVSFVGDVQQGVEHVFPQVLGFARRDRLLRGVVEVLMASDGDFAAMGGDIFGYTHNDARDMAEPELAVLSTAWMNCGDDSDEDLQWLRAQPDATWEQVPDAFEPELSELVEALRSRGGD